MSHKLFLKNSSHFLVVRLDGPNIVRLTFHEIFRDQFVDLALELRSGGRRLLGALGVNWRKHNSDGLALAGCHNFLVKLVELVLVLFQDVLGGVYDLRCNF